MADVLLIRTLRRRKRAVRSKILWRLKDYTNPFELNESQFIDKYRLSRIAVKDLCLEIRPHFVLSSAGHSLEIQVLNSLRLMGTGSFQAVTAESFSVSQSSVCRSLDKFLNAMMQILPHHINFPAGEEVQQTLGEFYTKFKFPNVIGAIDCTHIVITKPPAFDWFMYLNRKNKFSINVQMVCDANMKIMDVVARWPGSTHDALIWHVSGVRHLFHSGKLRENLFLLGDSGYPLEVCLLTPYLEPSSPAEDIFNAKHRSTRNVIERCFGVLKSRFRILHETGGTLAYNPQKVCRFVIAAAILHNICLLHNIEVPDILEDVDDPEIPYNSGERMSTSHKAEIMRTEIALRFQSAR